MRKRNRACEDCQRLKIKCDVSTLPGEACERCSRNNLECIPAAPRLQRDRISELEAQVQELQLALSDQSSSTTPSEPPGSLLDVSTDVLSFLDARIPRSEQQYLLHHYAHHAGAAWPVICVPLELDLIRAKSPILLLSILVYCVTQERQRTDVEAHDELVRFAMRNIGDEVIGRGQRSLEIVQALLVATFWNKSTRRGTQGSCYQILQLAADMAIDLGIGGNSLQPSPPAYFCRLPNVGSLEARRTWLACFVALETSSMSMRRPSPVPWDTHHQDCLLHLERYGEPSDILFCQIVRISQLTQEISNDLFLCHIATFVDGNDYSSYAAVAILKDKVDTWAAQIPNSLVWCQTLKVWQHVAMIHIYELVLHTPTNKASFAAPFIPGRITVKDFPAPANIIPPLQTALISIVKNCHAVIDTVAEMDPNLILSLPTFCFAPTILYSLFVLVTVMVAATDPAKSTYGQCLPRSCFRIEQCGLKLRSLTASLKTLDPTMSSWTTRMLDATSWLEEWYNDYNAILLRYEMNLAT